ncbi:MAG: DNA polymerase beta domain-containing protein [Candidatus Saganbacteria bacterium]|uniref:DNA polymerase beta domain-containing protein n=1 Tax=Candidatus Saganbacteria bacterium TaxID=2575572 RepID=A0A833NRK7_UNCSA|nr:MAG: DNA polymerase beta domain-containing protein [Candidatus Saganbacteria bacterium]
MKIKELYKEEIRRITDQIVEKYKPIKILLFGSCARGEITENSDIDILIIKDTSKRRIDRIKEVLFSVDNNLPFEPLIYTPKEIKKRAKLGDFFIKNLLKEGVLLYGR